MFVFIRAQCAIPTQQSSILPTLTKMPKPLDDSTTETRRHASHCLWLWVLWLTLFAVTRAAVADAIPDLLTPVQRAWLKAHPRILIGGGDDWPPWLIRNQSGTLSGFAVDHHSRAAAGTLPRLFLGHFPAPRGALPFLR